MSAACRPGSVLTCHPDPAQHARPAHRRGARCASVSATTIGTPSSRLMFSAHKLPLWMFTGLLMALELFWEPCMSQNLIQAALKYYGNKQEAGLWGGQS